MNRSVTAIVRTPHCKCCILFWVLHVLRRILNGTYVSRGRNQDSKESRTCFTPEILGRTRVFSWRTFRGSKNPALDKLKPLLAEGRARAG